MKRLLFLLLALLALCLPARALDIPAELDGDVVTATPLLIEMYSQTVNFLA